jgi:hypothetical protein
MEWSKRQTQKGVIYRFERLQDVGADTAKAWVQEDDITVVQSACA